MTTQNTPAQAEAKETGSALLLKALQGIAAIKTDVDMEDEGGLDNDEAIDNLHEAVSLARSALSEAAGEGSSNAILTSIESDELATILAALRFYQEKGMGNPDNRSDEIHDIATNGDEVTSLDDDGIDALCEKLNCAPA